MTSAERMARKRARDRAELERLRAALEEIAAQDWIENCLDPQWAARIARAALREPT